MIEQAADSLGANAGPGRGPSPVAQGAGEDGRSAKRIVYLSGAPRVSTKPQAAIGGARTRALGIIGGFRRLGFAVAEFIVGDHCPAQVIGPAFDTRVRRSVGIRLLSDLVRMAYAVRNGVAVFFRFRSYPLCYEMLGLMQGLGWFLQKRGTFWILETNALLFKESRSARRATFFWRIARHIEKKCYRRADLIVTVTRETKAEVAAFASVPADKIVVIPNGVDVETFRAAHVEARRFFADAVIGFVGVMYAWQGLDALLAALHELKGEGIPYKAVLVGDGPDFAKLKQDAAGLGLSRDVVFTGRVPPGEVPALIQGMDLCYSGQMSTTGGETSRSPIKTYEYMAMKKPVVSSDFEDARALIQDGINGYLFRGAGSGGLAEVLRRAFRERSSWPAMGENGQRIVVAGHTWEKRVQELVHGIGGAWS